MPHGISTGVRSTIPSKGKVGIEFVLDRKAKTAFPVEDNIPGRLKRAAMQQQIICYPGGGTVDGRAGAHLLLAPPYIAEEEHFQDCADRLEKVFAQVFGS